MGMKRSPGHRVDGGWGWLIVAACFVNNMLVIGLIKTYGILFVQFLKRFQASTSVTSIILGIKSAAFSLSAMLALNILITRISIRKLSLLGASLTSAGMLLSVFAKNVAFVTFSQSFLTGLGNAFVFGPGVYLLGQYFVQKRPLAISLANCGVSVGLMVLPPLITFLFEEYEYQGALLLLSGVMMQTIVSAAIFRPFRPGVKERVVKGNGQVNRKEQICSENISLVNEHDTVETKEDGVSDSSEKRLEHNTSVESEEVMQHEVESINRRSKTEFKEEKYSAYISGCFKFGRFIRTVDLSLFKSPIFIVILGFSFFGFIGNELCGAFIPPMAKEKGLTNMQTAELFTVAAVLDLFSRLLPGVIAQLGLMTRPKMIASAFVIMGVTFQFTSFYNSYQLMMAFIVVYGCFSGFFFSLLPVIIIDFIGLEKFPKAFGFVQVFQGIAGAVAYPLLGTFRDLTGTYAVTFHFLGANLLLASAILLTEPILRKLESKKTEVEGQDEF